MFCRPLSALVLTFVRVPHPNVYQVYVDLAEYPQPTSNAVIEIVESVDASQKSKAKRNPVAAK